ncbi:MAG: thrombospondin type 3 repeat-containing protein [Verrucomicrobiaceae bacterium]
MPDFHPAQSRKRSRSWFAAFGIFGVLAAHAQLDQNSNTLSDVWETFYGATGVSANVDSDGDGFSNAFEEAAGTNPFDPKSRPQITLSLGGAGLFNLQWSSEPGKLYTIEGSPTLAAGSWQSMGTFMGDGNAALRSFSSGGQANWFFRLKTNDVDSDGDGLTDWEESRLGFDPHNSHTDRNDTADLARVTTSWNASPTITVGLIQGGLREDWPAKGIVSIRRSGGMKSLTVNERSQARPIGEPITRRMSRTR